MSRLATFLLTVCLIADIAMPLMPGAFRFNTDESIDGVHVRTARVVVAAADRLPLPPRPKALDDRAPDGHVLTRRAERGRRPARVARPIRHLQPEPSPRASEDH